MSSQGTIIEIIVKYNNISPVPSYERRVKGDFYFNVIQSFFTFSVEELKLSWTCIACMMFSFTIIE